MDAGESELFGKGSPHMKSISPFLERGNASISRWLTGTHAGTDRRSSVH